jgi:hypothetical protein
MPISVTLRPVTETLTEMIEHRLLRRKVDLLGRKWQESAKSFTMGNTVNYIHSHIIRKIKSVSLRWMNHVLGNEKVRYSRNVLLGALEVNTIKWRLFTFSELKHFSWLHLEKWCYLSENNNRLWSLGIGGMLVIKADWRNYVWRFGRDSCDLGPIAHYSEHSCEITSMRDSSCTAWPFKMGPIGCPETSVRNYNSTVHKIPKERRSQITSNHYHQQRVRYPVLLSDKTVNHKCL